MNGDYHINTGPKGCWITAGLLMLLGMISLIILAGKGISWLVNHVHIG